MRLAPAELIPPRPSSANSSSAAVPQPPPAPLCAAAAIKSRPPLAINYSNCPAAHAQASAMQRGLAGGPAMETRRRQCFDTSLRAGGDTRCLIRRRLQLKQGALRGATAAMPSMHSSSHYSHSGCGACDMRCLMDKVYQQKDVGLVMDFV
jgi:hypothetical protein